MATVKSSLLSADLRADQDSGLDPLVFLAPPILEPDSDDPRVQAGHLHQLLLTEAEAEVSVTKSFQGKNAKRCPLKTHHHPNCISGGHLVVHIAKFWC